MKAAKAAAAVPSVFIILKQKITCYTGLGKRMPGVLSGNPMQ